MKRSTLGAFAAVAGALVGLTAYSARAQTRTWTVNADFDSGTFNNVVDTNPNNQLVLGPTQVSKNHLVYATNYLYGWVVRLDSLTGKQTARFDSSLQFINGQATGAPPPNEYCNFSSTGNCPGRVAVDTNGDVWIINRAFGKQGTLTKFAGNLAHCIDRNNNGIIDTSFDANNDGQISVVGGAGEYFGQNDECVINTIKIGPNNVWPRGVAVDKRGKIWASTWQDGKVYRINPNDPVAIEATVTVGGNPYSLATGNDYLFVSNSSAGGAKRVHITTLAVQNLAACPGTYGVVADPGGDIAWLGGYFTGTGLYRASFAANTCTYINTGSQVTAVTLDLAGNVWACGYNTNTIHKISPAGVILGTYPAGGTNPHGMSVDFQGNLWVINHGPTPNLTKINVNTGAIIGTYPLGGPGVPNSDPYLYSDFTGVQIDRQRPYTELGNWSGVFDGGQTGIPWSKVVWNTEAQGATPAETAIAMSVRAADTQVALAQAAFATATNNVAFTGIAGRYVEVRAALNGPGFVTPAISDITVSGTCNPVSETCCVGDSSCADTNPCTIDTCPTAGGACQHTPAQDCCMVSADCNDNNPCTVDSCPTSGGSCAHAAVAGCCLNSADCDDGVLCTTDICSGPGGSCSHPAIPGCCNVDQDCTSGSVCTIATCPNAGGFCQVQNLPNCCTTQAQCVDADPCTIDACDTSTGQCSHTPTAACCTTDSQCADTDPCTADHCSGPGGICYSTPISGCCNASSECNDGNACTTDSCTGPGGTCVAAPITGCCQSNADCADNNACTTDTCTGNTCSNTANPNCCTSSADCDDQDICTTDVCPYPGASCSNTKISSCCKTASDCPGGTCENNVCVYNDSGVGGSGGAAGSAGAAGAAGGGNGGAGNGGNGGAAGASGKGGSAGGGVDGGKAGSAAGGSTGDASAPDGSSGSSGGGVDDNAGSDGGCGCTTPGSDRPSRSHGIALLAGLALLVSRKRTLRAKRDSR
ncbi:MAG: hypothetical protein HY898_11635 [Deltaproteobacteria bacterium]|nr:hypothetical protein [Deltaproteobacteria bacterium]